MDVLEKNISKNKPEVCDTPNEQKSADAFGQLFIYLVIGVIFGIVFVKAEIISWYRIQEMFRLQAFHMYGVIGSAIAVGALSIFLIKKLNVTTVKGEQIVIAPKKFHKGNVYGGLIFGLGWAITGACPGPLYAQIGAGFGAIIITLLAAVAGTWVYGKFKDNLPH